MDVSSSGELSQSVTRTRAGGQPHRRIAGGREYHDLNRGSLMGRIITSMAQQERVERQARVERAIASVRLEGLGPTGEAKAVFDRYIAGDLTTEQMTAEIQALNAREFGPIHVYRD
jgi:DNA invertase Pin-like site-specific DNA recombinase